MVGDFKNKPNRGIIPRTFNYLFNEIIKLNKNNNNLENKFKKTQIYPFA